MSFEDDDRPRTGDRRWFDWGGDERPRGRLASSPTSEHANSGVRIVYVISAGESAAYPPARTSRSSARGRGRDGRLDCSSIHGRLRHDRLDSLRPRLLSLSKVAHSLRDGTSARLTRRPEEARPCRSTRPRRRRTTLPAPALASTLPPVEPFASYRYSNRARRRTSTSTRRRSAPTIAASSRRSTRTARRTRASRLRDRDLGPCRRCRKATRTSPSRPTVVGSSPSRFRSERRSDAPRPRDWFRRRDIRSISAIRRSPGARSEIESPFANASFFPNGTRRGAQNRTGTLAFL